MAGRERRLRLGIRLSMLQGGSLRERISIKDPLFGISNLKARRYAIRTEPCGYCNEIFSFSPRRRAYRHRNFGLQRRCGCATATEYTRSRTSAVGSISELLLIKSRAGTDIQVKFDGKTSVVGLRKIALSDLAVNSFVGVAGGSRQGRRAGRRFHPCFPGIVPRIQRRIPLL